MTLVLRFDIAVVTYNTDFYLHNLLRSIYDVLPSESIGTVHVWDNASSDATPRLLDRFASQTSSLRIHTSPINTYHGPALDALLRDHCSGEWVLLLDSDTEVRQDFVPRISELTMPRPAFVGQIHPQVPSLYAYLAHLMIHKPSYLTLPPFRHDGAPGRDFFRAIERQRIPYALFPWCEYVHHAGQGALRQIYERRSRSNEFYRFARRESLAAPTPLARLAREARLRSALAAFLCDASYQGLE